MPLPDLNVLPELPELGLRLEENVGLLLPLLLPELERELDEELLLELKLDPRLLELLELRLPELELRDEDEE